VAHHALGHARESQEALDALVSSFSQVLASRIAEVYAARGDKDRTFEWLDRALAQRDIRMNWIKYDPFLRKIRDDFRYGAILKKMNLPPD